MSRQKKRLKSFIFSLPHHTMVVVCEEVVVVWDGSVVVETPVEVEVVAMVVVVGSGEV